MESLLNGYWEGVRVGELCGGEKGEEGGRELPLQKKNGQRERVLF